MTENPRLKPDRKGVYYVRNRTLAPHLGRFLQRDPNATAQHATTLAWHGTAASPDFIALNLGDLTADGVALQQYARGDPLGNEDPTGLDFTLGQLMMTGYGMAQTSAATLNEVMDGLIVGFAAMDLVLSGASWQSLDADWAMDWSAPDFDSISSGVAAEAWGYSYVGEGLGYDDDGAGPAMAATYHANDNRSWKTNRLYEISFRNDAGKREVFKYGITSSALAKGSGLPKRVVVQMAQLRKQGYELVKGKVVETFRNRQRAANAESRSIAQGVAKGWNLEGNRNKRGRR